MRQRLDDDAFAINENDVSVPKDLDIEGSLAVFGVKPEGKNTIKSNLLNRFEPCIAKVLSEHHCKRGGRHGHRTVSLRGVNSLPSNKDHVPLFSTFGVDAKDDLFVVRHVGFFDIRTLHAVQLPGHRPQVKTGHDLLHALTAGLPKLQM